MLVQWDYSDIHNMEDRICKTTAMQQLGYKQVHRDTNYNAMELRIWLEMNFPPGSHNELNHMILQSGLNK